MSVARHHSYVTTNSGLDGAKCYMRRTLYLGVFIFGVRATGS